MSELERLAKARDAILLAEVAGLLHDWEKCNDMKAAGDWRNNSLLSEKAKTWQGRGKVVASQMTLFKKLLTSLIINMSSFSCSSDLKTLMETGRQPSKAKKSGNLLIELLGHCHDVAHFGKEEEFPDSKKSKKQASDKIASLFGYEIIEPTELFEPLDRDIKPHLESSDLCSTSVRRYQFLEDVRQVFELAWGDNRRPINEVTLWDWGFSVGTLYKAALAKYVLEELEEKSVSSSNINWRLLRISFDGLVFLEQASTINDLLGRQTALHAALDKVRELLEYTYPLGNEVYRDENGSAFVVPALEGDDKEGNKLRALLETRILDIMISSYLRGELRPQIQISEPSQKASKLNELLAKSQPAAKPFVDNLNGWWRGEIASICTACGVRPQGWGAPTSKLKKKAKRRNICHVCLERREERAKKWAQARHKTDDVSKPWDWTIWIDEVVDKNGRLALVVGRFFFSPWLSGNLVQTMLVVPPNEGTVCKNPSFARIRRIWDTMRHFWQDVLETSSAPKSTSPTRLEIKGVITPTDETLGPYHAYELLLKGSIRLSVLWDDQSKSFITIDNLAYIEQQIRQQSGNSPLSLNGNTLDVGFLQEALSGTLPIEEPVGFGKPRIKWGKIKIRSVTALPTNYPPTIPILSEPRTFMALVPANKALDVVNEIKLKYEREMGKVRNRLLLHLGVVYAHRRTPLRAVLDAGRRMLEQKALHSDKCWRVLENPTLKAGDELPNQALRDGSHQFDEWLGVKLAQGEHQLTWYVPAVMGDGTTSDNWYPYLFVETGGDDSKVSGRARAFKGLRPTASGTEPCWLVHAGDLQEEDQVYFTTATFDFEWLDRSARRFEIAYDEQGKRFERLMRPYLLDDLTTIQSLWQQIGGKDGLTNNQIYALRDLVESKRSEWGEGKTFEQLCESAVLNAEWGDRSQVKLDLVKEAVINGLFADMVELYMAIMKEKPTRRES